MTFEEKELHDYLRRYREGLDVLAAAFEELSTFGTVWKSTSPFIPAADRLELVDVEFFLLSARNAFSDYFVRLRRGGFFSEAERAAAVESIGARIAAASDVLVKLEKREIRNSFSRY